MSLIITEVRFGGGIMKNIKYLFVFFFMLLLSSAYSAEKIDGSDVIPEDSNLSFDHRHHLFKNMYYKGEEKIRVYYKIKDGVLTVFPDDESIKILPYQTVRENEGKPYEIIIRSKEWITQESVVEKDSDIPTLDEVKLALGKNSIVKQDYDGEEILVGNATVIIDNYYAGYECDNPFFLARIIKIINIEDDIKFVAKKGVGSCS